MDKSPSEIPSSMWQLPQKAQKGGILLITNEVETKQFARIFQNSNSEFEPWLDVPKFCCFIFLPCHTVPDSSPLSLTFWC